MEASNISIRGSFIGTNASGTAKKLNDTGIYAHPAYGLMVGGSNGLTPGGPCTGDCNLISGNYDEGVLLEASQPDGVIPSVQGNYIGTDVTGSFAIPNNWGVHALGEAGLIGGSLDGEGNLISGNGYGIKVEGADGTLIRSNQLGTAADGVSPLPNITGIYMTDSDDVQVGQPGDGNVIAFNSYGVGVGSGPQAHISQNSIHSNGVGIVNPVHDNPTITGVNPVTGTGCSACTIEVFSDEGGQGRLYDGTTAADGSGQWTFAGAVAGPNITATETALANGHYYTSEFSPPFPLPATPTPSSSPTTTPTATATSSSSETPTPTGSSPTPTQTVTPTPTTTHAPPTPTHTPTVERVEGDLDCDGHINLVDFDLLLEFVGQLNNGLTPGACPDLYELFQGQRWGDFNCDGFLTARDSLYLLEYVAEATGLPHPPAGCPPIGTQLA